MQLITPRRVKVYILNGENWIDNGTGYCTGEIDDKNNIPYFIVRNELDQSDIILKAYIEGTTQYQQQQETLIVWTDELGRDILLSFQEPNGCTCLCDFLIDVFQNYQPNISLVAVISNANGEGDITELIVGPVEYPPLPTMKNLNLVLECLNHGASSNYSKDQISAYILENDYITKLVELFDRAEAQRKLKNLHYLCDIMKILILYSNTQIIELLLNDSNIMGVVGILEYDSEFPTYKSNHRDYLSDETKFKEVVPIEDIKIKNKIKSTFRLQFLKDVVLAKLLDDATFNLIQTLIYFNQVDVIKFLQESNGYMEKLFSLYEQDNTDETILQKKRDGVRMLHQFALIAKTLQINQKTDFFKSLISKGLLKMINFSLQDNSTTVRVLCTELIVSIIEHDVMLFNEAYGNEDTKDLMNGDTTLIKLLTRLLIDENDIGLKLQAFELIKVLLDPLSSSNSYTQHQQQQQQIERQQQQQQQQQQHFNDDDDPEDRKYFDNSEGEIIASIDISRYIQNFYSEVAPILFAPLIKISKFENFDGNVELLIKGIIDVNSINDCILFQHLCDLLKFCTTKHDKSLSRSFFLENNILIGLKNLVHKLFKTQLRLSAIRSIKSLISLDDEYYTRYIIINDVLKYVVQFDLSLNSLATSTVLSIIEIEDINKDTEERKRHYDLIMSYINKLIKFEEDDIGDEYEDDHEVEEDDQDDDNRSIATSGTVVTTMESTTTYQDDDQNHQNVVVQKKNSKSGAVLKSIDDVFTNRLKREVSEGGGDTDGITTKTKKKVKWVKRLLHKK